MRKDSINWLELGLCSVLCLCLGFIVCLGMQGKDSLKIDLPEEYNEISKDSSKPTILQGYWIKDSLFIEFKND